MSKFHMGDNVVIKFSNAWIPFGFQHELPYQDFYGTVIETVGDDTYYVQVQFPNGTARYAYNNPYIFMERELELVTEAETKQMTKYNVGDRVAISMQHKMFSFSFQDDNPSRVFFGTVKKVIPTPNKADYNIYHVEIEGLDEKYAQGNPWPYYEKELRPASEYEKKPKAFNVGDTVWCKKQGPGYLLSYDFLTGGKGCKGVITDVLAVDLYKVKADALKSGEPLAFYGEEIEPYIEPAGERVTYTGTRLGPNHNKVLQHLEKTGTISIRDAMDDYGLSGGHITKIISDLRKAGYIISREFRKHPVTGRRYARYRLHTNDNVNISYMLAAE